MKRPVNYARVRIESTATYANLKTIEETIKRGLEFKKALAMRGVEVAQQ